MEPEEQQKEEVSRVTSGKAKSPGRVEWGRKLAALAKAHKEEKINAALKQPQPEPVLEPEPNGRAPESKNYFPWLALGSLFVGLAALYYQRMAVVSVHQPVCTREEPEPKPPTVAKPKTSKIIGMQ